MVGVERPAEVLDIATDCKIENDFDCSASDTNVLDKHLTDHSNSLNRDDGRIATKVSYLDHHLLKLILCLSMQGKKKKTIYKFLDLSIPVDLEHLPWFEFLFSRVRLIHSKIKTSSPPPLQKNKSIRAS